MPKQLTRMIEGCLIGHTFFTREAVESAEAYGLIRILDGFEWELLTIPADLPEYSRYHLIDGMVLTPDQVEITVSKVDMNHAHES